MKKRIIATAIAGLLAVVQPALSHNDGAYSHNYQAASNQAEWMARVAGAKRVSELSLPGTHDTMSIKAGDIWQNQTMTLAEQLNSGLRVFDMRTRHIDNKFRMHHGMIAQDTYFDDVLSDINNFLAAHPSETVLFRLRSEHSSEGNNRSYTDTLDSYLVTNGARRYTGSNDNPELDEIRGKFVILQEFGGADYGIPYGGLDKQDEYSLGTNWDLYDKWTAVKDHINKAKNGSRDTIYMNYLSGANGSFPYFVASGHSSPGTSAPRLATGLTTPGWNSSYPDFPRTTCFIGICTISFEGTNTLTADYVSNGGFTGMVMADFPGERLIKNIINLNDLSAYPFNEFAWGTGTNTSQRICTTANNCIEGDTFSTVLPAIKDKLTVVSYNVLRAGSERVQNQINWMKGQFGEQGPDVILLSEAVRGSGCSSNTARDYAEAFDAYYVYGNEDGSSSSCQTGNAIVSRYPMGNVTKVRFDTQHADFSSTSETASGRSFIMADVKVGDDIVHVYSTHTASPFGIAGDNARQGQHAEMVFHSESKPFTRILGGDLNAVGHIFADPLGLHDISLNPFFDGDFTDAHDDLWTHDRITSEAGLVKNDWVLLLDFIFVKNGSASNADQCGTECRDKDTLSDHAPIWADVSFVANGEAANAVTLPQMKSGFTYDFKLNTRVSGKDCSLQWDSDLDDGERNAKFDCENGADQMTFIPTASPWVDGNGYHATKGYIRTTVSGVDCHLEWDADEDDDERNAKFDCTGNKDEFYLTSHNNGALDKVILTSVTHHCGMEWDSSIYKGERNAKFDCDPNWDTMSMVNVKAPAGIERFAQTVEAAIPGYNNESLRNVTPTDCAHACTSGSRGTWCVSFDYVKTNNSCDLSSKRASDIGGLKTTYAAGLVDHYSLKAETYFSQTNNAAISGHNSETLTDVTPEQCAQACKVDSRKSWCVSFDYAKNSQSCDLSDKRSNDIGGLKTNYPGNPYDHYSLK